MAKPMLTLRNHSLSPRMLLILVSCLIVLEGCGFRLRGSMGGELALPPLYIQSSGSNPFVSELRQALGNTQTQVVSERSAAALIIGVGAEKLNRRVLTVDAGGRVQEYELHYAVSFAVNDASARPVLGSQTLSERRSFEFTGEDVLAKEAEELQIYQDMRRSAVRSAMRRLQALSIPAVDKTAIDEGVIDTGDVDSNAVDNNAIDVMP
ncbi:MAG: LPS assembly lipoprotein LptE [Gammaproteobacteria bacterium]|nr:LPS assembly lipoprotein LptE [Gammaproteobacteria bacterium]